MKQSGIGNQESGIGLSRKNPFSSCSVTSVPYFFPQDSQENELDLTERLEQCGGIAQIVGPHGTGKSTLLEALSQQLHQSGKAVVKTVLRDRQRRLPPDFVDRLMTHRTDNCVVLIDGYEQLAAFSRGWLCWKRRRLGFGLLITTHRPIFGQPILYKTAPNRETCRRIVQTLLNNEAEIAPQTLDSLFAKHRGNMRQIFLELYDQWEK